MNLNQWFPKAMVLQRLCSSPLRGHLAMSADTFHCQLEAEHAAVTII